MTQVTSQYRDVQKQSLVSINLEASIIKATQAFERISIDFKGPLPSATRNKYLLTMIEEYSHFLFAFPYHDKTASTFFTSR